MCAIVIRSYIVSFVACPQSKVITKELHDQSRVFVAFLTQLVEFRNRIIKCYKNNQMKNSVRYSSSKKTKIVATLCTCLCQLASVLRAAQDFVVKHRKVKCKTKPDWVCWSQGCLKDTHDHV